VFVYQCQCLYATWKPWSVIFCKIILKFLWLHGSNFPGLYAVAGSEDSNVYFYDLTKPKHTCVNKLQVSLTSIESKGTVVTMKHKMTIIFMMQGHRFPVMGIAWNHGENFLASSDFYGIVIVWKRERTNQNKNT
jgi:WD40 repeat protein